MYLEAVELCGVADVGEMVHVTEVPVVGEPGGQQRHPAQLVGHPLLQIGDHAGACGGISTLNFLISICHTLFMI